MSGDTRGIVRSPFPPVQVPDVPFAEFMFTSLRQYKDRTALVRHVCVWVGGWGGG